jgi:AAHS family 4-hydroxybenzoate transporter-like MFS transporter
LTTKVGFPPSQPAGTVDLGHLLDDGRWTGYQKWLVLLTAVTIVFDGVDNQLLGVSIPTIMKEWSVPRGAFAPVISLGLFGMMVGGAAAGIAGDRFGRRTALLSSMAVFGATTLGAALVHDTGSLGVLRFLTGIGLGGAVANAATLASEYVPKPWRAIAVTLTIVCVPLGATIAGLLGSQVLAHAGWRLLFLIGGAVPLVLSVPLFYLMPESPRYLVRHPARRPELVRLIRRMGHQIGDDAVIHDLAERPALRAPIALLFQQDLRRDTLALWGSFMSCLLAVYLGFSWLPSVLTGAGFTPAVASNGITAFNLGGVAGAIGGGLAFSRVGSRAAMLAMTTGAIAGAIGLSLMTIDASMTRLPLFALLTLSGGLINAVQTTMYALATHVYPSANRATGVGVAVAVGRLGAILSGYAGAWALEYGGSGAYFALMAATMGICFVTLSTVRRHVPATR